jgi:ABC-2 type transport system permease protein
MMMTRASNLHHALVNETVKVLLHQWSYRVNLLIDIVMFGAVFLGMTVWMGDGEAARLESRASFFMAYMVWLFLLAALSTMTWGIREETVTGTLEQMAMGDYPMSVLILGRSIGRFIFTILQALFIGSIIAVILNISLDFRWEILPVFLLTMIGIYGFSYILGGLTIVFKRVESMTNLLHNLVLFANGTFVAIEHFADWVQFIVKLVPTTQGIVVLRQMMFEGMSLGDVWNDGSLVFLTVHSVVIFLLGMIFFRWCEQVAKSRGTLGQY